MVRVNVFLFEVSVANNVSNAIIISLLATLAFTFFSMLISTVLKKNFIEPVLLGKIINYHLKDSPKWLDNTLGMLVHLFVGYLFTEVHLFLYRVFTPAWYNAILFGVINGVFGALIWYITIKIYAQVLKTQVSQYLIQLIVGHILFALFIVYMYAPPQ